ncbi:hypothetical protein [Rhodopila globiformis]|uniref:Uncharacterized protein n=1 Tax=Rhodopila globiformis TaxID=1071 RepID=A0A2S6NI81_RHOGL|nr:hypothetical protein [Rhodopila globiformis]PPQ34333.1 hypothetical protein CCS01_11215 [Rhodopila globiformis]
MVGDLKDFVLRLKTVLPKRWFGEETPNLDAILSAVATPWVWLYDLLAYVAQQARITTASDVWLDMAAVDYFGSGVQRKPGEADTFFRARIKKALLRDATTRTAITAGIRDVCGSEPDIFEPARTADTGAYGSFLGAANCPCYGMAYGQAGGWGNLHLPLQFFITVKRPAAPGVATLAGYGITTGAYSGGSISYVDLSGLPGEITDDDIRSALLSLLPVNATAWLQII